IDAMLDLAQGMEQGVGQTDHPGIALFTAVHDAGDFRIRQRASTDYAQQGHADLTQPRFAHMNAVEQRLPGLAAYLRILGQSPQFLVLRIVARGDRADGHDASPCTSNPTGCSSARTGAYEVRCTGDTPCKRKRSRCSSVG